MKMVTQRVLFEPVQNAAFNREMMNRVVNRIVTNVTGDETGPNRRRALSEKKREQYIKKYCQWNADYRRHDQSFRVVRIIVVNAMHDEMQLFPNRALRLVMKNPAVDNILEQRPDQHAGKK